MTRQGLDGCGCREINRDRDAIARREPEKTPDIASPAAKIDTVHSSKPMRWPCTNGAAKSAKIGQE
jgi:hypothetical protein